MASSLMGFWPQMPNACIASAIPMPAIGKIGQKKDKGQVVLFCYDDLSMPTETKFIPESMERRLWGEMRDISTDDRALTMRGSGRSGSDQLKCQKRKRGEGRKRTFVST